MHQVRREISSLITDGRFVEAFEVLLSLKLDAGSAPGLWEYLGRHARDAGARSVAQQVQMRVWHSGERSLDLALDLALDAAATGRLQDASAFIEQSFGAFPEDPEASRILAKSLANSDPERALKVTEFLGTLDTDTEVLRIDLLRDLGKLREADRVSGEALKTAGSNRRLLVRSARIKEALAEWEVALQLWRDVAKLGGDDRERAIVHCVRLLQRLDRTEEAYAKAAKELPNLQSLVSRFDLFLLCGFDTALNALIEIAATERPADSDWPRVTRSLLDHGRLASVLWLRGRGIALPESLKRSIDDVITPSELKRAARLPFVRVSRRHSVEHLFPVPAHAVQGPHGCSSPRDETDPCDVLLVNSTLGAGGAERQFVLLAQSLVLDGRDPETVHACIFSLTEDRGHAHFLPALRKLGIRIHDLSEVPSSPSSLPDGLASWVQLLPQPLRSDVTQLLSTLRRLRPSILHGWQDRASLASGVAGQIYRPNRTIMSVRNMQPSRRGATRPYEEPLFRYLVSCSNTHLTANSLAGAEDYARWLSLPPGTVSTLTNGVDLALFRQPPQNPSPRRRVYTRDEVVVGGVFRLASNKRPDLWIRTVSALNGVLAGPVRPRLVGAGPLRSHMERLARSLGVGPIEIQKGVTDPEDLYGGMDFLLLMSRVEGTPNVLLEAQALGLPIAACDVGGVSDAMLMEGPGAGLLLDPDISPNNAARCIAGWLPGASRLECRVARRDFVSQRFDLMALTRRLNWLYESPALSSHEHG